MKDPEILRDAYQVIDDEVQALNDLKAQNLLTLDISKSSNFSDWFVIATATSDRHAKAIANKFKESRPECAVVDHDCRGEYDGTDGILTDDRDEPLRPFKVGDTFTYTSPCDEGANIYWYAAPREGLSGSTTLIRTDYLRGRNENDKICLLYTSPSPRDRQKSRMPSSA